ncbi:hypothetical protein EHM76_00590 [bacterium]|nr:MAG: hypothetical protein EHM76_00590 [bacterium]
MLSKIVAWTLSVIALIAIVAATVAWYRAINQKPVSTIEYIKVPQIKVVTQIKTVDVPGPTKIVTVEKEVVVEKLKLPDWIKADENKQVIATAEIQPYKGKTNTVAILDTKSGASEIVAKQVPLPLFDFENEKELGLRAGVGIKNSAEVGIYGRWSFLRVGNAHIGAYGEANTNGDAKAQIEIGYRF